MMAALARFLQSLRLLHWSRAALFLGLIALACLSRVLHLPIGAAGPVAACRITRPEFPMPP
jgi:cytochrome b561